MPKVSVVIPTYNRENFLHETIESVLAQTYQDFEVIVVDDGSTDNTRELISAFPVRYFYQENQGVAAALNKGAELSRGEYIAFLGSDDVWLRYILEKEVEVLDKYPEVGLVYGQFNMMDESGTTYKVKGSTFMNSSGIVNRQDQIRELLFLCRIFPSVALMRRSCFDEVGGFNAGLRMNEDRHLFMRMAKRCRMAYIAEPLVNYRVHPNQLHRNEDPEMVEKSFLLVLREVFDDPELAPQFEPWKRRVYFFAYRRIAEFVYGRDMKMARRYLRKAVRVCPQILLRSDGLSIAFKYVTALFPNRIWLAMRDLKRHFLPPERYRE
jgi:glycosyltransferase involved in cell wall biosynthesis